MEKINIAELLKDCPQGMELYSPLCGKCVFDRLNMGTIICKKQNTQEITFTSEGYYMLPIFDNCECMIFPSKDQRDWSKFHRPFNDGDIVITTLGNTAIIKEPAAIEYFAHCILVGAHLHTVPVTVCVERLATEEEKQELFQIIKDKGYKWNEKTKTLEKLVVPNKFDINTLVPFESKVLVRNDDEYLWKHAVYGFSHRNGHHVVGGGCWTQCIPYEGNEHLIGKTDDCNDFYKTWK